MVGVIASAKVQSDVSGMVDELTDFVINYVFFAEGVRECEEDE